jgi:hypothetical protein
MFVKATAATHKQHNDSAAREGICKIHWIHTELVLIRDHLEVSGAEGRCDVESLL